MSSHALKLEVWQYAPQKEKYTPREFGITALSSGELMICMMLAGGLLGGQIADLLGLSKNTVSNLKSRAMKKLGLEIYEVATLALLIENRGYIQNPFAGEPNG